MKKKPDEAEELPVPEADATKGKPKIKGTGGPAVQAEIEAMEGKPEDPEAKKEASPANDGDTFKEVDDAAALKTQSEAFSKLSLENQRKTLATIPPSTEVLAWEDEDMTKQTNDYVEQTKKIAANINFDDFQSVKNANNELYAVHGKWTNYGLLLNLMQINIEERNDMNQLKILNHLKSRASCANKFHEKVLKKYLELQESEKKKK